MNFDNIPRNDMDLIDTLAFLKHYGYFDGIVEGIGEMPIKDLFKKAKQKKFESPNIREAVARFQDFYGITVDGNFGPETMRSMSMPRCGVPDIIPSGAAGSGQCKWPMLDVKYAFKLALSGLPAEQVDKAYVEACNLWNAVCGLRLTRIENLSEANIWAKSSRIDGRGGTLAWSYLPCGASKNTQLEQRYDPGENWSYKFAVEVICHEVGHAIGLNHMNGNSIMHPTATGKWPVPQSADISQVVSRYGKPAAIPEPEPPKPDPDPPVDPGAENTVTGTIMINGSPYHVVPKVTLGGL